MDPILFPKNNSLADAFTLLMSIHHGPKQLEDGSRIYRRQTTHNQNAFLLFSHRHDIHSPDRWVAAEFHQWEGYFYVYCLDDEVMDKYLPYTSDNHVKHGFNFNSFIREQGGASRFYTLEEVEYAAKESMQYLLTGEEPARKLRETVESSIRTMLRFQKRHGTGSRLQIPVADLAALIEKGQ